MPPVPPAGLWHSATRQLLINSAAWRSFWVFHVCRLPLKAKVSHVIRDPWSGWCPYRLNPGPHRLQPQHPVCCRKQSGGNEWDVSGGRRAEEGKPLFLWKKTSHKRSQSPANRMYCNREQSHKWSMNAGLFEDARDESGIWSHPPTTTGGAIKGFVLRANVLVSYAGRVCFAKRKHKYPFNSICKAIVDYLCFSNMISLVFISKLCV